VPDDVLGNTLEADKLSLEQTRFHWAAVLDPLRLHLGPWIGKSFTHILIDSYEAGSQNWTPGFREEFLRRKGYDPLPWLLTLGPTLTGNPKATPARVLGSEDQTARFDWDYRDVVAQLYQERSWEAASDLLHAAGLELAFEPYSGPFDTVAATRVADRPMLEFWTHNVEVSASSVTAASRAAGRRVVAAEAFTSAPMHSAWNETPGFLKASADAALASGVNRMVLHHWVHQPFDDRYKPGMGMGWWGTHFSRHQTWAEPGKAFFAYITRAQALLQRGETPIDIVSVGFDRAPDADAITMRAFLEDVRVVDGRVTLSSGRSYAIVHVPHAGALEPSAVKRIQHLLAQGAVVVSPRPDRSPSLAGYPACDDEVRRVAEQLWSAASTHPEHRVGLGRLFTELDEARRTLPLEPAARVEGGAADHVRIHARQDGVNRIFFVANLAQAAHVSVSFRVTDMQPELWDAETGTIAPAAVWRVSGSRTTVDLALEGATSVFVVFRSPLVAGRTHVTNVQADCRVTTTTGVRGETMVMAEQPCSGTATLSSGARVPFSVGRSSVTDVRGPWAVTLAPAVGSATRRTMDTLGSLSALQDEAAKYFSGTATYTTSMRVDAASLAQGQRVFLDLGAVADLARITLNGHDLGIAWHAPFVRDVTSALQPGDNTLVVAVTNTWHNRLVGDEQFPPDCEWGPSRAWAGSWPAPQFKGQDVGRPLKAYPDWFLANAPRPTAGRLTFTTWSYHRADTPLLPSGLLGPVRLNVTTPAVVQP
jgi:hypothetical protein